MNTSYLDSSKITYKKGAFINLSSKVNDKEKNV